MVRMNIDKIPNFNSSVNGKHVNGKADVQNPAQTEAGEAEDDSDDEKDEGAAAEGAGTSGGAFAMNR